MFNLYTGHSDPVKVLLVEDNEGDAVLMKAALRGGEADFEVMHVERLAEALHQTARTDFGLIVLDLGLPDSSGLEGLLKMRRAAPRTPVVVMTGSHDKHLAMESLGHGAQDYLNKDLTDGNLLAHSLCHAIERHELHARFQRAQQILEISESEQQRIGRDLHDGVCQYLTGVTFLLKSLHNKLKKKSAPELADVKRIEAAIQNAAIEVRNVSRGLCPPILEANDLISALKDLASSTKKIFRGSCGFTHDNHGLLEDRVMTIHLYRIAQEAVHNAIKHSQATAISMSLHAANGSITLAIKDNGKGFSAGQSKNKGMGLETMKCRARMIDASLKIDSHAKKGTSITCSIQKS